MKKINHFLCKRIIVLLPVILLLAGTLLIACGRRGGTSSPSGESGAAESQDSSTQPSSGLSPEIADSEFENRILIVDGKIYYGTSKIGPMGDAGSVDGHISSSVSPDGIPYEEGQSNFGCVGNPYTWDFGDGAIMVLSEDEEWHIFERRIEPSPSGTYCVYVRQIDEDILYADFTEWITPEDTDRILDLGLKESDLKDGYHIYNQSLSRFAFQLTDETIYRFISRENGSPGPGQSTGFLTETKDKDNFLRYLDTYSPSNAGMLFMIESNNGVITEIEELPVA